MTATYTIAMGERITELLTTWKLTTAATELVKRMTAAGHDEALALLAEVHELEAQARGERRSIAFARRPSSRLGRPSSWARSGWPAAGRPGTGGAGGRDPLHHW